MGPARWVRSTGENAEAAEIEPRFRNAHRPEYDDSDWDAINLPHTWNQFDSRDEAPGYWRGIGWYRKHFLLAQPGFRQASLPGIRRRGSVAEFWLNGSALGEHKGGYTSFEFDVTGYAKFGETENVLTVKVDNLFHATLPPTVKTDYTFYGGIYRDVWLRITDPTYISDVIWLTPSVSESAAALQDPLATGQSRRPSPRTDARAGNSGPAGRSGQNSFSPGSHSAAPSRWR